MISLFLTTSFLFLNLKYSFPDSDEIDEVEDIGAESSISSSSGPVEMLAPMIEIIEDE